MRARTFSLWVLLSACADQTGPEGELGAPIPLDQGVVYLDRGHSSLIYVEPTQTNSAARLELSRVPAGEQAVLAISAPIPEATGRKRLLVTDAGRAQVLAFDDLHAQPRVVATGVPLEALDLSETGDFAISYQPDGTLPTGSLFAFPNTVAVLDLRAASFGGKAVRLGAGDARPLKAVFAERLQFEALLDFGAGPAPTAVAARLALFFVRGGLVPVDLEHASAGTRIPLSPEPDAAVVPAEVLFTNNAGDDRRGTLDGIERAFVRSTDGEIYVLSLAPTPTASGEVRVRLALENLITPASPVSDIELFFRPDGSELLLAVAGEQLVLVDGQTGVASYVSVGAPVDSLRRYREPNTQIDMALAYSHATPSATLWRVEPLDLAAHRASGLTAMHLGSAIADVAVATGDLRAVLHYEDPHEIGVFDLATREVLDMRFNWLSGAVLSERGDCLWMAALSSDGEPALAEVTLDGALTTRQVALDRGGASIGRVGNFLWVDHADTQGALTVFPYDRLSRDAGVTASGLMLTDLLSVPYADKE